MTPAERQRELLQEAVREVLQEELINFKKVILNEMTKIVKSNKQVLNEARPQPRRVGVNPYEEQSYQSSGIEPIQVDAKSLFDGFMNADPEGFSGLSKFSF